ncbi:ABC transporter permease [Streptomyces indonesiensis]
MGGLIVALVLGMALLSFVWTPHDPTLVNPSARLQEPSAEYWFGTDKFGRDVFSQILMGSRTTLFVGFVAVGVAALVGVPLGIVAGMAPRWLGELLMRGNDLLLAFPALLLAIMFAAVYGASTLVAMVAIGIASIPNFARLIRGGTLQVMRTEYVIAARAAGRGPFAIGLRHVLPNVSSLVIVQASVGFAIAVLAEAALSFLGFGTPPPHRPGAGCCRRARRCCRPPPGSPCFRASRSRWRCSDSTCSVTACVTVSTPSWRTADDPGT